MGFSSIQTLAHSLEHVLNLMRECTLIPTSEIMDVMLRAADLLRNMINDINNSNNVDVGDFVIAFEPIANDDSAVAPAEAASADTAAPEAPPPFPTMQRRRQINRKQRPPAIPHSQTLNRRERNRRSQLRANRPRPRRRRPRVRLNRSNRAFASRWTCSTA